MTRGGEALVLLAVLQLGCGDGGSESDGAGAGATAGSGGVARGGGLAGGGVAATGGAAGAVLRGAVSLNIVGDGCAVPTQYLDFPQIAAGHPVTATGFEQLVVDGDTAEGGARVSVDCLWRPGSMSAGMSIGVGANLKQVSLGSDTAVGETSLGGISIDAPSLPEPYGSSPDDPCVYSPIQVDEATNTIWGEFSCGILDNEAESDRCVLGPSYFYFENCPDQ